MSWNFGPKLKNCKTVEVITNLVKKIGKRKILRLKLIVITITMSQSFSLNIQKARKELRWEPKLNLEETIKLTVDWYNAYFEHKNIVNFTRDQIQQFENK